VRGLCKAPADRGVGVSKLAVTAAAGTIAEEVVTANAGPAKSEKVLSSTLHLIG
jgi:hypothetical protein